MAKKIETKALLGEWRKGDIASRDALILRIMPELGAVSLTRTRLR